MLEFLVLMQFIPITTRILTPPQDNLLAVLKESLADVRDNDVLCISSKVVAIHEGRCVAKDSVDKQQLAASEADLVIPRSYWSSSLAVIHHTFLGAAGIDESNGDGHYILLPRDPFASAKVLHTFLCETYRVEKLGVIITDSRSHPFRYGATGVALAWWGIEPLEDHRGRLDLFGRAIEVERSNLVDGLAAGATVVAGEVDECIPVVIARNVPRFIFTKPNENTRDHLFSPYEEDTFRVLYDRWLPKLDKEE
jgi:coenzyme F420-0:L-glutamate ligase